MISYHQYQHNDSPLFSILIPTWNNREFLRQCLDSIAKNSRYHHQIVLHINEGTDGSRQLAVDSNIDHTFSTSNVGVCYALNAAFSLARAEYIVYLNDDMYVCPDWDHHLLEEIKNIGHDLFFLSSTSIEPKDVGKGCAIAPFDFGRSPQTFDESALLEKCASLEYADWNGASWPPNIVHRRLWNLVGGYSTEFFPGFYSDPDFSMKLWRAGVRIFKGVGKSRAYHFLEASTNKHKKMAVKKANLLFLHKWGITAKMFNTYYLRMGSRFQGILPEPDPGQEGYSRKHLACRIKYLLPHRD